MQTRAVVWGLFRESLRGVGEAPDRVVTVLIELHAGALEMLGRATARRTRATLCATWSGSGRTPVSYHAASRRA